MLKSFLQNGTIQSAAPIVNSKIDQVRDAEPIDTEEPLYVVVKNLPANGDVANANVANGPQGMWF